MVKVYPSQLTWAEGPVNVADSNSNCWRYILLAKNTRTDIHPVYKQIGELNEKEHYKALDAIGVPYEVEVPFQFMVGDVVCSGRVDVKKTAEIDECKATLSKSTLDKAPKDTHLYQLCLYLGHYELQRGNLVYGLFKEDAAGDLVRTDVNVLPVEVKDDGRVFVAKRETGYNLDQIAYPIVGLGEVLKANKIPDRPITHSWCTACRFCPVSDACDKYDGGEISADDLKQQAKVLITNAPQSEPKITKVKKNGKV